MARPAMIRPTEKPVKIIKEDGIVEWRLNGQLHRVDGPAVEWPDGYKAWYFNGKLHREDGPAINSGGFYLEGWLISEEEYMRTDTSRYPKLQIYQIMHS